jgi:tetratricopeptide (TPR) repeat protein
MKALEKDRNRRYETANDLARDLQRYLADEPVQACPPSTWYRFGKFAIRNRVALAMASLSLLALVAVAMAEALSYRNQLNEQRRLADRKALEVRLLGEKRANAMERAVMAATSGNFDEAERAIGHAELLGASTGQVRLLRGQVAYHRGDVVAATNDLEQAVRLTPESVAARAMLAQAYLNRGQTASMERLWRGLEKMRPSTPEDYLFKGQVESLIRPEAGLQLLDEAVRRRNSIIARGVRCEARANRTLATGEVRDAELALEDGAAARAMLPDNTFALASSVYAQLVAAGIYEDRGRTGDRRRVLEQAGRDVQTLRHHTSSPIALKVCYWYFDHVGDEQAALEISREGTQFRHACMLYRRGEYRRALQAADHAAARGYSLARIERGFILAEMDSGPARALAAAQNAVDHPDGSQIGRLCQPLVLLLLGRREEAVRASLRISQQPAAMPSWYGDWYLKYLDYYCGLISEASLLEAAGGSRTKLCEAHFVVGLRRLAEGDRAGAREHFRLCSQTRVFIFWDYDWARTFLRRLEDDPAWPPWISKQ